MPSAPTVSCHSQGVLGRSGRRLRSQPRRLELRRLASRSTTALLHPVLPAGLRPRFVPVQDLFAPPPRPLEPACVGRRNLGVGALALAGALCPLPRGADGLRHGLAAHRAGFPAVGCCPCPCLASGSARPGCPVRLVPAGWPHARLPSRWLPHPAGLPLPLPGARAGVSACGKVPLPVSCQAALLQPGHVHQIGVPRPAISPFQFLPEGWNCAGSWP